jgi:hypothetical protein
VAHRLRNLLSGKSSDSLHSRTRTTKLRLECLEPRLALSGLDITFNVLNPNYNASNVYITFIGGTQLSATYNNGQNAVAVNQSYTISQVNGIIHLDSYVGGRIFMSLGAGVAGAVPPEPVNPDIPSYHVRNDKIELTYQASDPNSCVNLTEVDYSAIPLQVTTFQSNRQMDVLTYHIPYDTLKTQLGALSSSAVLVDPTTHQFLRVLSPHTVPASYTSMQSYINAVNTWQTQTGYSTLIQGNYVGLKPYSTPATQQQNYSFTATVGSDGSLQMVGGGDVVGQNHTIFVSAADLPNGIYLGNMPWTVDGVADSFAANDVYAAALRDMLGGFNLGFVASTTTDPATGDAFGHEASSRWWSSKQAFSYLQSNPAYYNRYAQIVTGNSDAYSWAFSDLWSHVQAQLNSSSAPIDTMQITVLPDGVTSGPTIGSVVVVPTRGYMSWNVQDPDGIRSSTLTVDGVAVSRINGPYRASAGVNFSGIFGALSLGTHSYSITATDNLGNSSKKTGTFEAVAIVGPTIGGVVVVANKGLMSWNAQDSIGVAGATLDVDGVAVSRVNGPYKASAGVNFSGVFGALSVGTHSYTITATDRIGNSSQKTGTFEAVAIVGPAIANVVVAGNGRITWNAEDSVRVTGATLAVDGVAARVNGPYWAASIANFSGVFGRLAAGTHQYAITVTDRLGYSSQKNGSFNIAGLMVDASTAPLANATLLFDKHLAPIAAEAVRRLETQLGSQVDTAMAGVTVTVADLPAGMLGETIGNKILIDDDAAGYGWFVDPTPTDDLEFAGAIAQFVHTARNDGPAVNRVDLLTTVMHEMGHVLGLRHSNSQDLMAPRLAIGIREFLDTRAAVS